MQIICCIFVLDDSAPVLLSDDCNPWIQHSKAPAFRFLIGCSGQARKSTALDGTTLGANETLTADVIAHGNAVKLRGYVDFIYSYLDVEDAIDESRSTSKGDIYLIFYFSPFTVELRLAASSSGV